MGKSTSDVRDVADQMGRNVAGMARNFGGSVRKLQSALEMMDRNWLYSQIDELEARREKMRSLVERGPLFAGLQLGQYETSDELIAAMDAAGVEWEYEEVAKPLIRRIMLHGAGTADAYAIGVGEVSDDDWTRREAFEEARGQLRFGLVPQELVCLAAIKVRERLRAGLNPGVLANVWYVGDSESIVYDYGCHYVICFIVRDGRVLVGWHFGYDSYEWFHLSQFLCSRK